MSERLEFSDEQKQYLQGFVAGTDALRDRRGMATFAATLGLVANGDSPMAGIGASTAVSPARVGVEDIHRAAQDRFLADGKKLVPEEQAKRDKNPFEMWDEMRAAATEDRFPKGTDVFLYKFHGLFFVAPAQNAFMCRLRFPGGLSNSHQLRGIAEIAERCGAAHADVTTRANLQIREIAARHALDVITSLENLGIITRGAGADNIRNVTGTPTAGIDPQEIIDTGPLCREMHHYICHHREMYGLPRKFNIAFDGGGTISALADTNDIGFMAVRVGPGQDVPAGVYFRMELGGITGHQDFARDTGILLRPEECVPVAAAVVRVFIEHGDRTDRKKGAAQICARSVRSGKVFGRDAEASQVSAAASFRSIAASRAGRWRGWRMSAFIRSGKRGFPMSAWCCRSDGCAPIRCVPWPISPSASAAARSAGPCGKI